MSQPQASKGPTTGTHPLRGRWAKFAQAVLDADGDWVELDVGDGVKQSRGYAEVYRFVGAQFAEVRKVGGILYGRMREPK